MDIILLALIPVILLLVFGNIFRRTQFLLPDFWAAGDKLTYFVLFPSLLISKVSQVNLATIDFFRVVAFVVVYFFLVSLLSYGIYKFSQAKKTQLSSIYQGALRFNSYVYFAIIEAVWGNSVLSSAALIAGVMIPIVNVCCVASFSVTSDKNLISSTLVSIVKNPLIIAAFVGFVANVFPVLLPQVLFNTLDIMSRAALPLALLSVGAAVRVKTLFVVHDGFSRLSLWLTAIGRLVIVPALALAISYGLGVGEELRVIFVTFAAVPTATSSYILSKQMGGDADMMATIISLQTVLSVISLVFWLNIII